MGKKKRSAQPGLEEALERCWCYYCERDFNDLKILISHQRAKHFKCNRCNRRLNTVGGLSVHMNQVHKEQLTEVEGALANRNDINVEIFGMEGIPEDVMQAHITRVTQLFFSSEQNRAKNGNQQLDGQGMAKRAKVETPEEIKKRVAEFKAKRKAAQAGQASGEDTPVHASDSPAAPVTEPNPPSMSNASPPPAFNQGHAPADSGFMPNPYQAPANLGYNGYPSYPQYAPSPVHYAPFSQPPQPFSGGLPTPSSVHMPYNPAMASGPPMPPFQPPVSAPPMSSAGGPPTLPQPSLGLPQRPAFAAPNLSKEEMAKMHSGMSQPPSFGGLPHITAPLPASEIGDSVDELIRSVTMENKALYPNQPVSASTHDTESSGVPFDRRAQPMHASESHNAYFFEDPPINRNNLSERVAEIEGNDVRVPEIAAQVGTGNSASDVANVEDGTLALAPATPAHPAEAVATGSGDTSARKRKKPKHDDESMTLVYNNKATNPEETMGHMSKYHFDRAAKNSTETVLGEVGPAVTGDVSDGVRETPSEGGV